MPSTGFSSFWGNIYLLGVCLQFCLLFFVVSGQPDVALKKKYESLYTHYTTNKANIKSDCKLEDSKEAKQLHHWGTITSLKFLSEQSMGSLTMGERLVERKELRMFLARVGYLQTPGSLVFLDKQTSTMRLHGCPDKAMWRLQGEKGIDKEFQEDHNVGDTLKAMAPNAYNYIHKFTCYSVDSKCSHVFFVITKPLPELPLGLQVPEGTDSDEYSFACTVPFCRVQDCPLPNSNSANRRSYPPFRIKWVVPDSIKNKISFSPTNTEKLVNSSTPLSGTGLDIKWENKIQKEKSSGMSSSDDFQNVPNSAYRDGFGVDTISIANAAPQSYAFQSRIVAKKATNDLQHGLYECIILDANGVPSTPSVMFEDYRGNANINVMPFWQRWLPFVIAIICCILVALIIFLCPNKMEYDDGTPYTKDELVSPATLRPSASE